MAAVKRSCKPAATPQGFPTSIQPRSDHPGLRQSNQTYSTTYHTQSTHKSEDLGEHLFFLRLRSDPTRSSILFEMRRVIYRAHDRHLAHAGHTPPHKFQGDSGSFGVRGTEAWRRRFGRERTLLGRFFPVRTRGVVESRLLWPAELQHGFIVAVAHQVSKDRRHRRTVGRRVRALYKSHKQSTSVNGYVYMRR